jgi:hypothetical protein
MLETTSAYIFSVFAAIVIIFQGCLAAGLPWGAASMGGKYPGKYPPHMRGVAVVNMLILALVTAVILSAADVAFPQLKSYTGTGIWAVVAFFVFGTITNIITPSKIERIWIPVNLILLATSLIIALG